MGVCYIMELKNKIALITGGTQGYGRATAAILVQEGAKVIITARKKADLEKVKEEIGCEDIFLGDVTSPSDWEKLYCFIKEKYGKLDILINNAGGGIAIKDTIDQSIEDIDRTILLNLNSVIYGSRLFGRLMKENKSGTIINISSACAKEAWPQWSVYAASKWAVLGFSKGLYVELQPYNIRVTCIVPSAASTGFQSNAGIEEVELKLKTQDIGRVIADVCKLPQHVVVEEVTVWGIDQVVVPL